MSRAANDLIEALGLSPNQQPTKTVFMLGTIPASYSGSGRPTIQFDGESVVGSRQYPYLGSYTPTAGDRVLVALVGHGGVILGKVT